MYSLPGFARPWPWLKRSLRRSLFCLMTCLTGLCQGLDVIVQTRPPKVSTRAFILEMPGCNSASNCCWREVGIITHIPYSKHWFSMVISSLLMKYGLSSSGGEFGHPFLEYCKTLLSDWTAFLICSERTGRDSVWWIWNNLTSKPSSETFPGNGNLDNPSVLACLSVARMNSTSYW